MSDTDPCLELHFNSRGVIWVSKAGARSPEVLIPPILPTRGAPSRRFAVKKTNVGADLGLHSDFSREIVQASSHTSSFHPCNEQNSHTDSCTVLLISQCGPELSCALQKFRQIFFCFHAALQNLLLKEEGGYPQPKKRFGFRSGELFKSYVLKAAKHFYRGPESCSARGPDQPGASGEPRFTTSMFSIPCIQPLSVTVYVQALQSFSALIKLCCVA